MLQIGGRPVALRVVRTAERFPSTRGDFAIADRAGLEAALNLADPGSGFPTEVWANAADAEAERAARSTLRRAPFDALVLDSRVEREQALRNDPISSGSLAMLAIAAAAAFLLALFALALTTLADLRDDRDALLDLESQGASPGTLRRVVRIRQLVVGLAGLVGASSPARSSPGSSPTSSRSLRRGRRRCLRSKRRRTRVSCSPGLVMLGLVGAAIVVSATRCGVSRRRGRPAEGGGRVSAVELRDVFRVHSTPEGDAAALQGLTLTVAEGELLAVLGPSGSGKTSMLRLLAGVDRASAGTARVFGSDLGRLGARALARYRAKTIGYVDQRYAEALDPRLTIADSIALRLRLEGDAGADRRARELLDAVGLAGRPARLSL